MRGLNAEQAPDPGKCEHEWTLLGHCDDESNSKDGKGCCRLNEYHNNTCIHSRHLWGEYLPYEAHIYRSQRQIIEVTMMFKSKLSATQGTAK